MNRLNEIEDVSSNTTEQLIHHLCAKLASNLMFHREEYIDSSYKDSIRLFCSTSYGSVDDAFELIQKIKQKCNLLPFWVSLLVYLESILLSGQ